MAETTDRLARTAARLEGQRWFCRIPLWVLAGAVAALGQAPLGLWPATILGLTCLFALWRETPGWRRAAWIGWWAGCGYFAVALSWIVEPFLVDAARHGWMAAPALILLAAGLALFWALACGAARALGRSGWGWIGAMVLAEALRGVLFTGFPWARIGHVLVDSNALGWASVVGALGLCAMVMGAAVALRLLLGAARVTGAVGLALLAGAYLMGPHISPAPQISDGAPVVRLVQPNAEQHEKWDRARIPEFFERQLEFTRAPGQPDLIVWPETAIASLLANSGTAFRAMSEAAGDVPVVVGLRRVDGTRIFNTLAVLGPGGQVAGLYDKHHLVPFGEYVPFGDFLGRFGISGMAAGDGFGFSPGPGPVLLDVPGLGPALPLICYEGVFPRHLRGTGGRANFILLITNDAWFGKLSGPYQHLAQARLRSAEQGLPMVRVANTGISAVIDAAGQVTAALPLGAAGWRDVPLPPPAKQTWYASLGDWPMLVLALLMLALSHLRNPRRRLASRD